jgi:hypothetical protein
MGRPSWIQDGADGHNFERDPPRLGLIWFSGFRGEDLNVIFYQNMPNLHNRYISAESKNFTEKPGINVKLLLAM